MIADEQSTTLLTDPIEVVYCKLKSESSVYAILLWIELYLVLYVLDM